MNRSGGGIARAALIAVTVACGFCTLLLAALGGLAGAGTLGGACGPAQTVGATEYGGPGDPSSGTVGASGVSLLAQPDSYAELGGTSFQTATALGGLPYGTPLEITAGRRSVIAYKEDIGLGGGPIDGYPREIDLWWELARSLGISYEQGRWSGTVQVQPLASDCAGAGGEAGAAATPLAPGQRATLLPDGAAAAPAAAPAAVKGIIAAGNQIVGRPYLYGGAHGLPLNIAAPYYDCSSSVAHLLYGGGLLPVTADMTSSQFESWGLPGPGRWVTIYASASHVYMYVAGLRWDTHNAAGPEDGSNGIGWHPLVRSDAGFVVRHPPGL
jgi:cell wall-associated NlpC family hydrolase